NPLTGSTLGTFTSPVAAGTGSAFGLATTATTLLVGGSSTAGILELNPNSGATIRTITNPGVEVSGIAYLNKEIYLLTNAISGQITVLDYATGAVTRTIMASPVSGGLAGS